MALSNFKREPRREATEQIVGLVAVGLYVWLIVTLVGHSNAKNNFEAVGVGFALALLIPSCLFVLYGLVFIATRFIHAIGEIVCALLRKIRLDPRPTQRY